MTSTVPDVIVPEGLHPCLVHAEVHQLDRWCWNHVFLFFVQESMARPRMTDQELQERYDLAFERACLDEITAANRRELVAA